MNIYDEQEFAGQIRTLSIKQLQILLDFMSPYEKDREDKRRLIEIEIDRQKKSLLSRRFWWAVIRGFTGWNWMRIFLKMILLSICWSRRTGLNMWSFI